MPGVVFAHGMSVDKDGEGIFVRAFDTLASLGYSVLRFDFRAHGKSQGVGRRDFTVSGELRDAAAALGLAGASFGGGVAALLAGQDPQGINAVFLANPLLDYQGILDPVTPWGRSVFQNWRDELNSQGFVGMKADWSQLEMGPLFFKEMQSFDPSAALARYPGPVLAVHGDRDDMVDLASTRRAFGPVSPPHRDFKVIVGSGHGFHDEPYETQVADLVTEFFKEKLAIS